MKNKLFLALSLLTAAFSVSADYANQANQVPGRFASYWTAIKNGTYNAYTTSTQDVVNASVAGVKSAYNGTTTYAVENPYKTAGIVTGATALIAGTVIAYKKGYLKNPFAKAKAAAPVVTDKKARKVSPKKVRAFKRK